MLCGGVEKYNELECVPETQLACSSIILFFCQSYFILFHSSYLIFLKAKTHQRGFSGFSHLKLRIPFNSSSVCPTLLDKV